MSSSSFDLTNPAFDWTVGDVLTHLGDVPAERVRLIPHPGEATEADVLEARARSGRLCELIDGVLVEKTVGLLESRLAIRIAFLIEQFLEARRLGIVVGPDGFVRILPQQVRAPDVAFFSWDRLPNRRVPREPIPAIAPDLAIEVLSPGNTPREMERKLHDYFDASVRLVWYIDPRTRTAVAYTAPDASRRIDGTGALDGADVLPGFTLPLRPLFASAEAEPDEV